MKAEVRADDVGDGLGFQFGDVARHAFRSVGFVQRFVRQFMRERFRLLAGRTKQQAREEVIKSLELVGLGVDLCKESTQVLQEVGILNVITIVQ